MYAMSLLSSANLKFHRFLFHLTAHIPCIQLSYWQKLETLLISITHRREKTKQQGLKTYEFAALLF